MKSRRCAHVNEVDCTKALERVLILFHHRANRTFGIPPKLINWLARVEWHKRSRQCLCRGTLPQSDESFLQWWRVPASLLRDTTAGARSIGHCPLSFLPGIRD